MPAAERAAPSGRIAPGATNGRRPVSRLGIPLFCVVAGFAVLAVLLPR